LALIEKGSPYIKVKYYCPPCPMVKLRRWRQKPQVQLEHGVGVLEGTKGTGRYVPLMEFNTLSDTSLWRETPICKVLFSQVVVHNGDWCWLGPCLL